MLVNKIFLILSILIILIGLLEYLKKYVIVSDVVVVEGMGAVIGPVIKPIEKTVNKPKNTYYENNKITQDFDKYSVIQDYEPNSIIIQEEKGYVLTN